MKSFVKAAVASET